MQRLQPVFQRAVFALALLTTGLAGGFALHDPNAAHAQPCRVVVTPVTVDYASNRTADSAAQADCSCGNA